MLREGYKDGSLKAVLALTVFALGQTAVEATLGEPISVHVQEGVSSGFRGGSVENPPGIELFSAALRPKSVTVIHCQSCRSKVPSSCHDFRHFLDMTIT